MTASSPSPTSSASLFEYDCEAVRVRAKRIARGGEEEHRKFSVDPNLTSYDILKSILSRAFDLTQDDFVIYFLSGPNSGCGSNDWLPLLSDWDLDVAILSAADPHLSLWIAERRLKKRVTPPAPLMVEASVCVSSGSGITAVAAPIAAPVVVNNIVPPKGKGASSSIPETQTVVMSSSTSSASKSLLSQGGGTGAVFSSFKQHVEKSLPSLTNRLQKAMAAAEESIVPKGQQVLNMIDAYADMDPAPMSEKEFRTYLNKVGEVVKPKEMRLTVYQCGAEPQIRKVLWKHLLGVYPNGMTGKERVDYIKAKVCEYEQLKQMWTGLVLQGRVTDDLKYITNMVKKDVLRTDRHHVFFSGEGNPNVTVLYNILTTFALNHPSVGYCQGMSDLLSPLLVVMADEGHAYISFCSLMSRLKPNFHTDGKTMTKKFEHLSQGLLFYDPEFYAYLKLRHADDLLYCYRWLLLEMKREFCFDDACAALEVLWASLPPPTPLANAADDSSAAGARGNMEAGVRLFEHKFRPKETPKVAYPFPKKENVFTNVVSSRKRLSSLDESVPKGPALSASTSLVLQSRARIQSAGSAEDKTATRDKKKLNQKLKKSKSLLSRNGSNDSGNNVPGTSPLAKEASGATAVATATPHDDKEVRKVKDLKDFYKMAPAEATAPEPAVVEDNKAPVEEEEAETDSEEYTVGSQLSFPVTRLPPPIQFGDGNPFLMFMCLACILTHRDYIMEQQLDYQEIAMFFDRMVRRHDVMKTLRVARKMFAEYLNDDWKRDLQAQQQGGVATAQQGGGAAPDSNQC